MKKPEQSLGEAWRAGVLAVLDDIATITANQTETLGNRIHELRKAAKHGRAILKLAPDSLGDRSRRHRESLRNMRRLFGPARDARVDQKLFDEFCSGRKSDILGEAGRKIAAKCEEQESKAPQMRGAARTASRIAKDVRDWPHDAIQSEEIIERAVSAYKKARRLLPTDESPLEDLHDFRSTVVDHRYQMRLFASLGDKSAFRRERLTQELRESLGEYLDIERLIALLHGFDVPDDELKYLRNGQQKRLKQSLADAALLFDPKPRVVRKELEAAWQDCG